MGAWTIEKTHPPEYVLPSKPPQCWPFLMDGISESGHRVVHTDVYRVDREKDTILLAERPGSFGFLCTSSVPCTYNKWI